MNYVYKYKYYIIDIINIIKTNIKINHSNHISLKDIDANKIKMIHNNVN